MSESCPLPRPVAARIIQCVGESGVPPELGADHVQVGFDSILRIIEREYLDPMAATASGSAFKLVQAYFGGGKSLFLRCVRQRGWNRGMCAAIVSLSPTERPFDNNLLVYQGVAEALTWPPPDELMEPTRGVDDTLRAGLDALLVQLGEEGTRRWIDGTLRRHPIDSRSYRAAVVAFLRANLDGDSETEDLVASWLHGERVTRREVSHLGIREEITRVNGFRMLRSLVQVLQALGGRGLVLAFDEMDRNISLPPRRRRAVADNLREMVDHCGAGVLPGVLCLYAVPPEFLRQVVPEYPALQKRLLAPHPMAAASPQSVVIDLEELGPSPKALLAAIGLRLLEVFEVARDVELDRGIQETNLEMLAEEVALTTFEVGHRRDFAKAAVDLLHRQTHDEHVLSAEELAELTGEGGDLVCLSGGASLEEF
ncbi:MAG TPA: BREX system ATP-binding domain-containing protein [Myxococcota bacterium]|nr:BREX system ATP-binding domain-containing protein [Myxococcota bacterium]